MRYKWNAGILEVLQKALTELVADPISELQPSIISTFHYFSLNLPFFSNK